MGELRHLAMNCEPEFTDPEGILFEISEKGLMRRARRIPDAPKLNQPAE